MALSEKISKLDALKEELKKYSPLPSDIAQKVTDKYRLEWNFHSNHIEGNTLTYGQTRMLLFFGKSTGDHEKRDFDEMEAHDIAVRMIKEWALDKERDITETEICQLNKIILVKSFWKEAVTAEGTPTKKEIIPGAYKSSPNSVRLKNGQIHHYASPEETPVLMKELFDTYVKSQEKHPLIVAALVHHRFTEMHPFDDGNGRVSRLWANYILLKNGYTPLIIRTEKKEDYLTALQKADAGDLDAFVDFLVDELIWSMEISIKAAKGESIEEDDDLDKKIAFMDAKVKNLDKSEVTKSADKLAINNIIVEEFQPLIFRLDERVGKVKGWFNEINYHLHFNQMRGYIEFESLEALNLYLLLGEYGHDISKIHLKIDFTGFKKAGVNAFNTHLYFGIEFQKWKWVLFFENVSNTISEKLYDESFNSIDEISKQMTSVLIEKIDKQIASLNK